MAEIFLILLVCPLAVGGVTLVRARNAGASFFKALGVSLLAAVVSTGLVLWAVNECELSAYLRREMHRRLAPEEVSALEAERLLCPTSYTFQWRGRRLHAFAAEGFRGAKVFIGED
jgi:hypothetical protein